MLNTFLATWSKKNGLGFLGPDRPKICNFQKLAWYSPKMETNEPNVYPTILGGVSRGFWSPFEDLGARSAIFWHLKTGTFGTFGSFVSIFGRVPSQFLKITYLWTFLGGHYQPLGDICHHNTISGLPASTSTLGLLEFASVETHKLEARSQSGAEHCCKITI